MAEKLAESMGELCPWCQKTKQNNPTPSQVSRGTPLNSPISPSKLGSLYKNLFISSQINQKLIIASCEDPEKGVIASFI